jgi:hypothetical protein
MFSTPLELTADLCGNKTLPIKEGQGRCFENLQPKLLLVPLR